eukprot:15078045-Heterocapsa_arctica.AAC.1
MTWDSGMSEKTLGAAAIKMNESCTAGASWSLLLKAACSHARMLPSATSAHNALKSKVDSFETCHRKWTPAPSSI